MSSSSSSSPVRSRLTDTQKQQRDLEKKVELILQSFASVSRRQHSVLLELWRDQHIDYLLRGLEHLGPGYCVLDSNRPWLCYWILHSLALLGEPVDGDLGQRTVDFLRHCQDPEGGYGGGPGQMPHLATTYAAVCSLITIGSNDALASINREKTFQFLLRMKDPSGGFRVHTNGEMDVRGCYTAIVVAHMLNLLSPPVVDKVADYIVSCQTYEGGIAGEPGAEAHGGYTYCGLATLVLINQGHLLDLPRLVNWSVFRQGKIEGGFQGRANKLVDGCYSFWQGGLFPLIQRLSQHAMSQQTAHCYTSENILRDITIGLCKVKREQDDSSGSSSRADTPADADDHRHTGFKGNRKSTANKKYARENLSGQPVDQNASVTIGIAGATCSPIIISAETLFPSLDIVNWGVSATRCDDRKEVQIGNRVPSKTLFPLDFPKATPVSALFNAQALQGYILLCCQVFEGGLRDKPGKVRDYYHTCYCLSGLSTAQYSSSRQLGAAPNPGSVVGPYSNLLEPTHPLCNVVLEHYESALNTFCCLPVHIN
eukprot:c22236_g2_i1 orf=287-1906(+)